MKTMSKRIRKFSERGQAIILIAAAIVGLVAIVGLMVDGGILLIEYARLKRGIDAASIAAASQFRKNFDPQDLVKAGEEFLKLNQSNATVTIYTCNVPGTSWDASLCAANNNGVSRKLVRVTAEEYVQFGFMRVVGMNGTWISASSVGEAASVDMVLVIDTSTSMAFETNPAGDPLKGDPSENPEVCNALMNDPAHRCEPLGKVIDAAIAFVDQLFFPYDQVALVSSTGQDLGSNAGDLRQPVTLLDLSDDEAEVKAAIRDLKVFQPARCPMPPEANKDYLYPCLFFNPTYITQTCYPKSVGTLSGDLDPTTCGPSNIGGGLYEAGYQFANARQDSFWVVISLFGGPANASDTPGYPDGRCPVDTWEYPGNNGYCRDLDPMPASFNPPAVTSWEPGFRDDFFAYSNNYWENFDWSTYTFSPRTASHSFTVNTSTTPPTYTYGADYDADDYARDGADFIAAPQPKGQGATLFAICMGEYCRSYTNSYDPASAEFLGRYMAEHAGDDLTAVPPVTANHGLYFFAEDASVVDEAFLEISKNILTRLSK
ncbi:MAG: hypothetical protein HY865_19525 [Chloroflexi bacterium]|nr:hypothetical protein [Chloroflexota bacterium]